MSARILEAITTTVRTENPDITSPYGAHGNPPMWDILRKDGRTLAIRPERVLNRLGFGREEKDGFVYGWHIRGEWPRNEQHLSGEGPEVAELVARLLPEGATPVAQALLAKIA